MISVVVPVSERPASLSELYQDYAATLKDSGRSFEFIFVVLPWFRQLARPLRELAEAGEPIRVLDVGQGVVEATLVKLGVAEARGELIVTLPAYYRVTADAISDLLRRVEEGADMAVARRWPRRDSWVNRLQNRAFHGLLHLLAGGRLNDVACGVRAMRRELLQQVPIYGDFLRFLPLFAIRDGYRVEEVPCAQHAGDRAARLYGPGIYLRRLIDLLGLVFLLRFTEKPLRFFGLVGALVAGSGGIILVVLFVQRLLGQGIANRPLLLLGVLLVVLGVQAIALGLVGEIIVHLHARRLRPYRLAGSSGSRTEPHAAERPDPSK